MAAFSEADIAAMKEDLNHGRHTEMFAASEHGEVAHDPRIADVLLSQVRRRALATMDPSAAQKMNAWHSKLSTVNQ
jgi:hypothetical protein